MQLVGELDDIPNEVLEQHARAEQNRIALEFYRRLVLAYGKIAELEHRIEELESLDIEAMMNTLRYLCESPNWIKYGDGKKARYILEGFDGEFNPNNHHVEVRRHDRLDGYWQIEIKTGPNGEHVITDSISGGFKKAQEYAVEAAIQTIGDEKSLRRS